MPNLPDPVPVSPTIKLFRWSFLIAGIIYGFVHKSDLAKKEALLREEQRQINIIRDAKLAEERRIASERDLAILAAYANPEPKEE